LLLEPPRVIDLWLVTGRRLLIGHVSQTAFLAANGGVRVAGNTDKILIKVNTSALARWQSFRLRELCRAWKGTPLGSITSAAFG
jgi:hypothetical protein